MRRLGATQGGIWEGGSLTSLHTTMAGVLHTMLQAGWSYFTVMWTCTNPALSQIVAKFT